MTTVPEPVATTVRLDEIKAFTDAAQGGPWTLRKIDVGDRYEVIRRFVCASGGSAVMALDDYQPPSAADLTFMVHAREWVPLLITEVERLRAALNAKGTHG